MLLVTRDFHVISKWLLTSCDMNHRTHPYIYCTESKRKRTESYTLEGESCFLRQPNLTPGNTWKCFAVVRLESFCRKLDLDSIFFFTGLSRDYYHKYSTLLLRIRASDIQSIIIVTINYFCPSPWFELNSYF